MSGCLGWWWRSFVYLLRGSSSPSVAHQTLWRTSSHVSNEILVESESNVPWMSSVPRSSTSLCKHTCSSLNMLTCEYKRAQKGNSDTPVCLNNLPERTCWFWWNWFYLCLCEPYTVCACVNTVCSYTADWVITWSALREAFSKQTWPPTTPRISATFSKWTVKCSQHQPVGTSQLPVLFPVFSSLLLPPLNYWCWVKSDVVNFASVHQIGPPLLAEGRHPTTHS